MSQYTEVMRTGVGPQTGAKEDEGATGLRGTYLRFRTIRDGEEFGVVVPWGQCAVVWVATLSDSCRMLCRNDLFGAQKKR